MHGARGKFSGRDEAEKVAVLRTCSLLALRITELRIVVWGESSMRLYGYDLRYIEDHFVR